MKLVELYEQTPAERHRDIKITADRVLVRESDGGVSEYLIIEDGELWPVRPDKALKADIAAIRDKLGA